MGTRVCVWDCEGVRMCGFVCGRRLMSVCKTVYGGGCVCMSETELHFSISFLSGVSGLRNDTLDLSVPLGSHSSSTACHFHPHQYCHHHEDPEDLLNKGLWVNILLRY